MKIKKTYLYAAIVILIVSAAAFYFLKPSKETKSAQIPEWSVDSNGYLSYPLEREDVAFNRQDYGIDGNLTIHKIIYPSRGANIHALLVLPTTAEELLPGIILLPGAGVSKESELGLAKKIAQLDAAVLVIDQRGVGETRANVPSLREDLISFSQGSEPFNYLIVYDALRAFDLLDQAPFIDSNKVIIVGESLGGRIAIIAAAIDRNVKGALAISTAGFDYNGTDDNLAAIFGKSIDPDHYIGLISPRKLVMMHNYQDTNVPIENAARTFEKASVPKEFALVNDTACNHGYCDSMYNGLVEALDYLVDIRSRTLVNVPAKQ